MLILMFLGIPIAYAITISSFLYILFISDLAPMVVVQQIAAGADSLVLLALPFFLLAGEIMNRSKITERLTRLVLLLIGPRRGGLSLVVVVANVLIAMVSGAAIASAAAVGSTMIPMMRRQGYPKEFAAALNASAATIGPVIPPSIGFIIYASVSGQSVGKLFLAGIIPGLLIGLTMIILCAILAVRHNHPQGESHSFKEIFGSFFDALPGLFMPVIILGGIFGGLVTPTEAGVLAVVYGLIVGLFIYRTLKFSDLPQIFLETIRRSSSILFIIAGASCFGFLISRDVDAELLIGGVQTVVVTPWMLLPILLGLILLLGTFMEGGSLMIILTPLLLPILVQYGIDPIHFGVVFQVAIMIGLLTPPVGILVFVISGVSGVSVKDIFRNLLPFYLALLIILFVLAYVPTLSLYLVHQFGGLSK